MSEKLLFSVEIESTNLGNYNREMTYHILALP